MHASTYHRAAPLVWLGALATFALAGTGGCARLIGDLQAEEQGARLIVRVSVEGNDALSDGELTDRLAMRGKSGLNPFSDAVVLDNVQVALDRQRIKSVYAVNGYFHARVSDYRIIDLNEDLVEIRYQVVEGPPTRIAELSFDGFDKPPKAAAADDETRRLQVLHEALPTYVPLQKADVWNEEDYKAGKSRIRKAFRDRGFLHVKVGGTSFVDREANTAVVRYTIVPGALATLGKVTASGMKTITETRVLQRVPLEPKQILEPADLEGVERRVYDLGVFFSARAVPQYNPETKRTDLDIQVQEMPLRGWRAGVGIELDNERSEAYGLGGFEHKNLLGGLRRLDIEIKPSLVVLNSFFDIDKLGPAGSGGITFRQPSFGLEYLTFTARAGYELGFDQGYQSHKVEAYLGFAYRFWNPNLILQLGYKAEEHRFFAFSESLTLPLADRLGLAFRDAYSLRYGEFVATLDLRDNPFDARSGMFIEGRALGAFKVAGNQFEFAQFSGDLRFYLSPVPWMTFAIRTSGGYTMVPDGGETPLSIRFKGGGASSMRGFAAERMGPFICEHLGSTESRSGRADTLTNTLDAGTVVADQADTTIQPDLGSTDIDSLFANPASAAAGCPGSGNDRVYIGGNVIFEASAELRLRFFDVIGLVAFFDVGEVWLSPSRVDFGSLQMAPGVGVRYFSPIGPIRFDVGFLLTDPIDPLIPAFHLSLGQAF